MQYQNIERSALENDNFRKVMFTNKHSQVVLMSLLPGEDIGREVHEVVDQVLFFVKGVGEAVVGSEKAYFPADPKATLPSAGSAEAGHVEALPARLRTRSA